MMRTSTIQVVNALLGLALLCTLALATSCKNDSNSKQASRPNEPSLPAAHVASHGQLPKGVQSLLRAYPRYIKAYDNNSLVFYDGTLMTYDSGARKTVTRVLNDPDPCDLFYWDYKSDERQPGFLVDPGRTRNETLFQKMYGSTASEVRERLVPVQWFGGNVLFSQVNGAADSLKAVYRDLKRCKHLQAYLKSSGTFYWRKIKGTDRQSAHSYGIAIDIWAPKADYWKWKNPGKSESDSISYVNHIPLAIVEAFERHCFIWGGRWYHFDTMHFEYRPEYFK